MREKPPARNAAACSLPSTGLGALETMASAREHELTSTSDPSVQLIPRAGGQGGLVLELDHNARVLEATC